MRHRTLAALAALGVTACLGLAATAPAQAAPAAPTNTASQTPRTPRAVAQGKVTDSHKATAADVAAGAAATATVYDCAKSAPLNNPDTGGQDNKLGVSLAWQESVTASGRPEARVKNGHNAIYVFNNRASTGAIYSWTWIAWKDYYDPLNFYVTTRAAYNTVNLPDGHTAAVSVLDTGYVDVSAQGTPWANTPKVGAGYRNFITNYPNDTVAPDLQIGLQSHQKPGAYIVSNVVVQADGDCGALILY